MSTRITLLILAATALIVSCNKPSSYYDSRLKVINKTSSTISIFYTYSYPDTSLPAAYPSSSINANNWIAVPGASITIERGGTWDNAFKDQIPSGKMTIFVLDNSVVQSTPWDSIRSQYKVLKRFDVTLADLQNSNFILQVP